MTVIPRKHDFRKFMHLNTTNLNTKSYSRIAYDFEVYYYLVLLS